MITAGSCKLGIASGIGIGMGDVSGGMFDITVQDAMKDYPKGVFTDTRL